MRSEMSGNVLMNPVLKTVKVKGEDRQICELRVMCSEYKSDGNGGYVQDDTRTFPVQVTIWHEGTAKRVYEVVRVGASVSVIGATYARPWVNEQSNQAEAGVCMDAEKVTLGLQRVEAVQYRAKAQPDAQKAAGTAPAAF
jgi:single-strand DNA-binding protein